MGHNSAAGLLLLLVHAKRLSGSLNRVLMNCVVHDLQYVEPTVTSGSQNQACLGEAGNKYSDL